MVHAHCEGLDVLLLLQGPLAPWLGPLDDLPRFLSQGQRLDSVDHQVVVGPGHRHACVGHDPFFKLRDGSLEGRYTQVVLTLVCLGLDAGFVQLLSEGLELQLQIGPMMFLADFHATTKGAAASLREQVRRDNQGDKPKNPHSEDLLMRLHMVCSKLTRHRGFESRWRAVAPDGRGRLVHAICESCCA